jgi:hypothetical protein
MGKSDMKTHYNENGSVKYQRISIKRNIRGAWASVPDWFWPAYQTFRSPSNNYQMVEVVARLNRYWVCMRPALVPAEMLNFKHGSRWQRKIVIEEDWQNNTQ